MSDETVTEAEAAEEVPSGPHPDDNGAVTILQLAERGDDGSFRIARFKAYAHGLGAIGAQGYFRLTDDGPWEPAGVDWIVTTPEGTVYVIHRR